MAILRMFECIFGCRSIENMFLWLGLKYPLLFVTMYMELFHLQKSVYMFTFLFLLQQQPCRSIIYQNHFPYLNSDKKILGETDPQ